MSIGERKARQILIELHKAGKISAEDLRGLELKSPAPTNPDAWPEIFTNYKELTEAEEPRPVIDQIMSSGEITIVGALPKHGKTWFLLAMAKALLSGEPFLNFFPVPAIAARVLYLVPEAGLAQVKRRLNLMRLMKYVNPEAEGGQRLFVMPRRINMVTDLADPRILRAAEGADVFLDTLVRFVEGDENKVEDVKRFSNLCLNLATIARSVTIAHHSPKQFGDASTMTLENMLRGSGDLGAMLSNAFGIRQIDKDTNRSRVSCLAQRDNETFLADFQIEGRPHINNSGNFAMTKIPGQAGEFADDFPKKKAGRHRDPKTEEWLAQAIVMEGQGLSQHKIAETLKKKGFDVSQASVSRRISEERKKAGEHQGELDES